MYPYYVVTQIDNCPECGGMQTLHDPTGFWQEFWTETKVAGRELLGKSDDDFADTFANLCAKYGTDPDNPPPEETPCDCGTGFVRREVSLEDALGAIGYPAPTELDERYQRLMREVRAAANEASCLANGILPD